MKTKLVVLVLSLLFPVILLADPAKKVTVTYSKESKKLSVVIDHPVANVKTHFIDVITIVVDGKVVKEIKPTKQTSLKAETLDVEIPEIKAGSKVEVKTHCNEFGTKSGKLTVK